MWGSYLLSNLLGFCRKIILNLACYWVWKCLTKINYFMSPKWKLKLKKVNLATDGQTEILCPSNLGVGIIIIWFSSNEYTWVEKFLRGLGLIAHTDLHIFECHSSIYQQLLLKRSKCLTSTYNYTYNLRNKSY